jgi:D-aminopeptidase
LLRRNTNNTQMLRSAPHDSAPKGHLCILVVLALIATAVAQGSRPRARDIGVAPGVLAPGPLNAITDVAGVKVGHATIIRGDNIRTGVTAVLPHSGNLYREKVPGAIFVGNGFGKLAGSTQVDEMGEIETPILLTSTTSVSRVADALISYMLALPGNEDVLSINPVVGETNDGYLSDIRGRHIMPDDVFASRRLPASLGGYTIGVLVQTNFGGVLTINGAPVGRELGRYYLKEELGVRKPSTPPIEKDRADGSVMIVVATDAPLDHRNLERLAARAIMGLARTGSSGSNGSGDYVIAFSSADSARIRRPKDSKPPLTTRVEEVSNDSMSPLFQAVIEATEEAIYNSLFRATTITGQEHTVEALPIDKTLEILRKYNALSSAADKRR